MKVATLTITCVYADDAEEGSIEHILHDAVKMIAGNGFLTADGEIELESWDCDVKVSQTSDEN